MLYIRFVHRFQIFVLSTRQLSLSHMLFSVIFLTSFTSFCCFLSFTFKKEDYMLILMEMESLITFRCVFVLLRLRLCSAQCQLVFFCCCVRKNENNWIEYLKFDIPSGFLICFTQSCSHIILWQATWLNATGIYSHVP